MRVFPRNAVMDRKMFSTERKISCLCIPFTIAAEQNSSSYDVWPSSSVKFAVVILLQCKYVCTEVISFFAQQISLML